MTTFNRAQIPDNVTSIEQLVAWAQEILVFVNPSATLIVGPADADLVVQSQTGRNFPQQAQSPNRYVYGGYLPKTSDSATLAAYIGISEITPGQIPAVFRKAGT